jgi:hypothetical protein
MIGYMFVGKASVENLSGPISIAQYAGKSAEMGLVAFLKFLAIISVSLGVLNLLPILQAFYCRRANIAFFNDERGHSFHQHLFQGSLIYICVCTSR